MTKFLLPGLCLSFLLSCTASKKDNEVAENSLFKLLDSTSTNILFHNVIKEDINKSMEGFYQGFYSGGGVALGDLDNDGLDDVYFSGNMNENKLYRNLGNMNFEDITAVAGVAGRIPGWKNGVNMVDINADGYLDIYVCYAGRKSGPESKNQLFINKGPNKDGIPVFKDEAEAYGLADPAYSTQSVFFDYDRDGDLDMLLINDNIRVLSNLDDSAIEDLKKMDDPLSCSKLFRNDAGHFTDLTKAAGLNMSTLSYGLGGGVADINGDGWPDIYLSNDYAIPDRMYMNNQDGTFTDQMAKSLDQVSLFSMGNNVVDINNDGFQDIFTLDMLPEDNRRQKLLAGMDNYEAFNVNLRNGFHYQYMRNMLQINNGNGTFSEIAQLAGIANTDWSWAPLFADYNNDGWKDLFITNGFMRDFTNMDVLKFNENFMSSLKNGQIEPKHLLTILENVPSSDVKNYIFKNNGDLTFTNKGFDWGINIPSNSNGAAYSDLDNDGDLDIVVNNINKAAFVYENRTDSLANYLKIKLQGSGMNRNGLGAVVTIFHKGQKQCLEQMPSKGYLSSVSQNLHFGLGKEKRTDSMRVVWLSGRQQVFKNIEANKQLTISEINAADVYHKPSPSKPVFKEVASAIVFEQAKNSINDFKRQPLLVNSLSFSGPCMTKGDVNGDGLEDVFVGGDMNTPGTLFIQQKDGKFMPDSKPFSADKDREDTDAVFFDANGDGFIDLYVASGGYHNYSPGELRQQDRLYLNDGKGRLSKADNALPEMLVSTSCVRVADFNGDGHPDLFAGGRVVPGRYPEPPASFLLINDGKGRFSNQIKQIAPELEHFGMISDAACIDLNGDKKQDLVVVGEWMPLTVFINEKGKFKNRTSSYFDKEYSGWWNKLQVADMNNDGRPDLIVGNLGLNSQCKASDAEPAELIYKDFDDNGAVDPILCFYIMGKSYPYLTRDELLDQMSMMRPRFPDYKSYADAGMNEVFTKEELEGAKTLKANYLKTAYFESSKEGRFKEKPLPVQAQFSPVYTITPLDYNGDGHKDLLLCGNMTQARIRFGKYAANHGVLLKGNGKGGFSYVPDQQSGLKLKGDVRSVISINNTLYVGINQQKLRAFQFDQHHQ